MSGIRENNINQYGDNSHKSEHMYETKDDNLGRRLFLVQKDFFFGRLEYPQKHPWGSLDIYRPASMEYL